MVFTQTIVVLIIFAFIILASAVKICPKYERAFVFRLGRLILPPKGPGVFLIIPIVDRMIKINLRSERDLEAAGRLLEEARTQKDANLFEIDRHLRELAEIKERR
jgi:regulator of protease activity HflC (stomatin/prohibitin superfamily)